MAKWTTHVDNAGTYQETEVHEILLKCLTVEVSKQKGDKLWTITFLEPLSCEAIGTRMHNDDLIRSKMLAIEEAMKLLAKDSEEMIEATRQTHGEAVARRDALLASS